MKNNNVISYTFIQRKAHEKNYSTHDLTPIVIFGFNIYKYYLYGVHVNVFIDYKIFQYSFKQKYLFFTKVDVSNY